MKKLAPFFVSALLVSAAGFAQAATTADDAAKLSASLKAYLGKGADSIEITPDGDGYKAILDFSILFAAAKKSNVNISMSPVEYSLKPGDAGKWTLHSESPFTFSMDAPGQFKFSEKIDGMKWDGTFDSASGILTDITASVKSIDAMEDMVDAKGTHVVANLNWQDANASATTVANAGGGIDTTFKETFGMGQIHEIVTLLGREAVDITVNMPSTTFDGAINGLQTGALLDLWKFLVAHGEPGALAKDQSKFKDMLAGALPIFANTTMQGTFDKVDALSPKGKFSVDKLSFKLAANGATKDGKFEEGVSIEGLSLPPRVAPAWSEGLLPKSAAFDFSVSGYDLQDYLVATIKASDFSKNPALSKADENTLAALLMPTGTVDIAFSALNFVGAGYNLESSGQMSAGSMAQPTGTAHIKLKGLDYIKKIIEAAPPEAGLADEAAVILLAKGLAETDADGNMTWDIVATPDHKTTINGTDLSKLKK